jgi:hypothetical protein
VNMPPYGRSDPSANKNLQAPGLERSRVPRVAGHCRRGSDACRSAKRGLCRAVPRTPCRRTRAKGYEFQKTNPRRRRSARQRESSSGGSAQGAPAGRPCARLLAADARRSRTPRKRGRARFERPGLGRAGCGARPPGAVARNPYQ